MTATAGPTMGAAPAMEEKWCPEQPVGGDVVDPIILSMGWSLTGIIELKTEQKPTGIHSEGDRKGGARKCRQQRVISA